MQSNEHNASTGAGSTSSWDNNSIPSDQFRRLDKSTAASREGYIVKLLSGAEIEYRANSVNVVFTGEHTTTGIVAYLNSTKVLRGDKLSRESLHQVLRQTAQAIAFLGSSLRAEGEFPD